MGSGQKDAGSVTVLVCREGPTGQAEHAGVSWLLNSTLQLAWRQFLTDDFACDFRS